MTAPEFGVFLTLAWEELEKTGWHWFSFHFFNGPRPFARCIIEACGRINDHSAGMGTTLFRELLSIGGVDRHQPHYEQLMQKLAEILVIERIVTSDWPEGTTFEHEPSAFSGGPRPELLVAFPGGRLVVEVKTPSMLNHVRQRHANGAQLAYRGVLTPDDARRTAGQDGLTLPRDYPVRDFLADADRKFAGFRDGNTASLLVVVWDDFIYEPISILANQRSGLLTPNTFERDQNGEPRTYPNLDAVVVLRHLNYFIEGAAERDLMDRKDGMDFGDGRALPNVFFDVSGIDRIPVHVIERLRAYYYDDPGLLAMAEYNIQDVVFWN
ncbi:hypothetical protein NKJ40_08090 [Mesorhizobium sp. M0119]|uniref:hypothetical protein n=1 Tax=unclassified Mesorhizobium TaxID=325217 RepID=UPI003336E2C8